MNIKEKIKEKPYWDTSELEYYERGYRKLLGIPGRVLQGREVTSLSSYPLFVLKELLSIHYKELDIVEKITNTSLPKITSEIESIITFKNEEVIDENIFNLLVDKANKLKLDIDNSNNKVLNFTTTSNNIFNLINDINNHIGNFNNTNKAEIKNKLNTLINNTNTFYTYLTGISSNFDTFFSNIIEVEDSLVQINNNINNNELFKNEINKIIKNNTDNIKTNEFENRWNVYNSTLSNTISVLNNNYSVLMVNILVLDEKISNAQTAINNNTTNAPEDTLPKVIELNEFLITFEIEVIKYVNSVNESETELVAYLNEIIQLKSDIIG